MKPNTYSLIDKKEEWNQPHLIILGQGKPEENVLAGCKSHAFTGTPMTPTVTKTNCNNLGGNCGACQSNAAGSS